MQQHAREGHRQNRIAFKLQRRAVGQQHRQEEEGGVGNNIQQLIRRAGFANHPRELENGTSSALIIPAPVIAGITGVKVVEMTLIIRATMPVPASRFYLRLPGLSSPAAPY